MACEVRVERHPPYRGLELERLYRLKFKRSLPFWEIAAQAYDQAGTGRQAAAALREQFGIRVSDKTVIAWINQGFAERAKAEAEAAERVVEHPADDEEPVAV